MKKLYFLIITLFAAFTGVNAQSLLLYENFDYSQPSLLSDNGWTQVGTTATNPIMVTTLLAYPGYPNHGGAAALSNTGQDVYKDFSQVNSGSVYVSLIFNVTTARTGDFFLALGHDASTSTFASRLFVKSSGTGFVIGISKGTEPAVYDEANVLNYNETYLAVIKHTFNTVSNTDDQSSLFVIDGKLPAYEPVTPTVVNSTSTSTDLNNVSRLFLRQGSASSAPNLIIDGIMVSNTWASIFAVPVNMLSFDLAKQDKSVKLSWTSAQEKNAKEYVVERSANGKDGWSEVTRVAAQGNTSAPTDYTYTDANPLSGVNFYRLKMVDLDDSYEYYKTVSINLATEVNVRLYPNPAKDVLYIDAKENLKDLQVDIYSVSGARVLSVNPGSNTVDISKLQAGVYFVKVTKAGGASTTLKIVKL